MPPAENPVTVPPSPSQPDSAPPSDGSDLIAARREKLRKHRAELGIEPYGQRVDGLMSLAAARALHSETASAEFEAAEAKRKADPTQVTIDGRPKAKVAGRLVQHRDIGKLVFIRLRDASGDLQVTLSKGNMPSEGEFTLAKQLDYGDIVVAEGPIGRTKTGEICVWASRLEMHSKSVAPPPEKWHGLTDPEIRYRKRYVDMYSNPEVIRTFEARSRIVSGIRRYMETQGYLEVETPMMQPIAGGAAARPFTTHHNALDMTLFMRIAPELYLKRLLVGGMSKVFEINRNFRNEGVDRSHNPEFTAMEAYQAFGDYMTMLELVEGLVYALACQQWRDRSAAGLEVGGSETAPVIPFGSMRIDYRKPFERVRYAELFERACGFPMADMAKVRAKAREIHVKDEAKLDDWLVVNEVFEEVAEPLLNPERPTFVLDYPSAISPLTRPSRSNPVLCDRWDLFIGGMEVGPAYSELNDPDIQRAKFTEQLRGADDEESTFRTLDHDFLESLEVGMPPAGGMGLGVDRLVMLLTDSPSIRDVILFPLLKNTEA
ncbi:MAG: lysine--tRNA ligase [Phycisphaerae bacterium]|jgi:lysyl-tRNA synthetase class 2|nr:lysine--tRNA ligase [Phycisphaerae bacterium]